jgi:hypothetical protein
MKNKILMFLKKRKLTLSLIGICLIFYKKVLVIGMIGVGYFIFPEASQALNHYCFGNGETLYVDSKYIKTSPVVLKALKNMKVGEKKKVGMHQWEDWRLSFAINPFTIEKKKDKVVITQWMQFAKKNDVITWFGPIPIPDNIVHTFDCTPYLFYSEFEI